MLVAGSGPVDRDSTVAGIPVLSQLAGALAEQGFLVLRYDKRAVGQSGGRSEAVTQADYADDLIAIVKWLAKRDDVDSRRIVVAGHGEGGTIAHAGRRAREEDRHARADGHRRDDAAPICCSSSSGASSIG